MPLTLTQIELTQDIRGEDQRYISRAESLSKLLYRHLIPLLDENQVRHSSLRWKVPRTKPVNALNRSSRSARRTLLPFQLLKFHPLRSKPGESRRRSHELPRSLPERPEFHLPTSSNCQLLPLRIQTNLRPSCKSLVTLPPLLLGQLVIARSLSV